MRRIKDRPPLPQVLPLTYEEVTSQVSAANPLTPAEGVTCWVNPLNGFAVMGIEFTADPQKRDPDWERHMSAPMGGPQSPDWQRSMRLAWDIRKGEKIYGEFIKKLGEPQTSHVIRWREIPSHWSRRRGIDPGSVNPFAVGWWTISPEGIRILYDELYVPNAWCLKIETPKGFLSSLDAMKYLITVKSGRDIFAASFIDPSSSQRTLLGRGPESPRCTILSGMRERPYPVDCDMARKRGKETIEIDHLRHVLFARKHYATLSDETLEVLGLKPDLSGYELFGGYFMANCTNHIREFANLTWEEAVDPLRNRIEAVQDYDNHCYDAARYANGRDWDPSKRLPAKRVVDFKAVRAEAVHRNLEKAGRELQRRQNADLDGDFLQED